MSRDGIEPSLKDFQSNALPLSYREELIICFCKFFFNFFKEVNFFFFFFFGTAIYLKNLYYLLIFLVFNLAMLRNSKENFSMS